MGQMLGEHRGFLIIMEEEKVKRCFKCGCEKPLSEFYKHPRTADGHLNKCKDCTKNDVNSNYEKKSKNEEWIKKERVRSREKYHRLNYKDRPYKKNYLESLSPDTNAKRALRSRGIDLGNKEAHHWNYNYPKSIIPLSTKAHRRIHSHIIVNRKDKFCYTLDGVCLDTEEKTLKYYKEILDKYDDLNDKLEIINY